MDSERLAVPFAVLEDVSRRIAQGEISHEEAAAIIDAHAEPQS